MIDWQPIETAPKDGTVVLLWSPQFESVQAAWAEDDYNEGQVGWVESSRDHVWDDRYFTHWALFSAPEN